LRYMTDAQLSGLAKELREKRIDCRTVHMLMRGNEDSRVSIDDSEILKFLMDQKGGLTLITLDKGLARYCATFGVPCIRVQNLVADHIKGHTTEG
jgi:hypothetical protein